MPSTGKQWIVGRLPWACIGCYIWALPARSSGGLWRKPVVRTAAGRSPHLFFSRCHRPSPPPAPPSPPFAGGGGGVCGGGAQGRRYLRPSRAVRAHLPAGVAIQHARCPCECDPLEMCYGYTPGAGRSSPTAPPGRLRDNPSPPAAGEPPGTLIEALPRAPPH